MNTVLLALAAAWQQAGPSSGGGDAGQPAGLLGCGGQGSMPMLLMVAMFAIFYLILIRPQQKRQKLHQAMLAAIKKGDQIVTRGGLVGRVSGLSDKFLIVELQEKVRVRVMRTHIDTKIDSLTEKSNPDASESTPARN